MAKRTRGLAPAEGQEPRLTRTKQNVSVMVSKAALEAVALRVKAKPSEVLAELQTEIRAALARVEARMAKARLVGLKSETEEMEALLASAATREGVIPED